MSEPRRPGQRAGLDRPTVLAAARELLADQGLEALTMRALARRLGVSPNALYSHVETKTALVDDVLDDVLSAVEAPDPEVAEPSAGLHALMASTYDVLLAHRDLVSLYLVRQGARGPNAEHLGVVMLELLAHAGVTGARAREALHVLIVYTIGFAAFSTSAPLASGADPDAPDPELAGNFDSGLRWVLSGILSSP